ncbi:MAG TPA: two-component regulator propeller domain-containing protein [Hanamia sp.]|nr:two-component regulator propeller domain-containing protein [Hanamia sp.]
MKIRFPFFLSFTIILSFFHLSGFTQEINFEVVNPPKDGPWQLISGMSQGPDGFLWISNYTGVYKYDGQQFTHYLHDPKNPNSIAGNRIECILAANDEITWIGTYVTGLDHLDPATGIVTHFRHLANDPNSLSNDTVTALMQDKQGTLWVGTYGGLDRFNPKTRTFTHFAHIANDPASLSNNLVRAIYEDHEGVIWVGTGSPFNENAQGGAGGLNRFDRKTGTFKSYLHDPKNPNSIADNRVRAIFEDSKGNFWVGTAGDGLQTLNRATGVFTHYYYDPAHPEKLSRPALEKTLSYVDDHITFITEDNAGRIWIGTMEGGINVYDPSTKKVTHFSSDKNSKEQLATNEFWYAYKTRDGIIWISTWGLTINGIYNLYKINPYQNKLPHHYIRGGVNAFAEDSAHTLWLASNKGLIHIDSNGKEYKFLIDRDTSSPKNVILDIEKDKESNTFWVATPHGLHHFDPVTKTFKAYHHIEGDANSLLSDTVFVVKPDTEDKLWVGTFKGLQTMDIKTGTFTKRFQSNARVATDNDIIEDILPDKNNQVWIATRGGLNKLDELSGHFKRNFIMSSGGVNCIMKDSSGNFWAAANEGLYKYNKEKDAFALFSDASGALNASTSIGWITEDHEKNLWLKTNSGIIKLNAEKNTTVVYGKDQGVDPGAMGSYGYTRENGEILYGDSSGYFAFQPKQLMQNIPAPQISITNFLLSSKAVVVAQGSILPLALAQTKKIDLGYNQNTFSFEFASIDYASTGTENHLQYMLENYDHNWQVAGENKAAYYFNVAPGSYIFKVKAVNDSGVWAEKDITIIVSPPWWKTWWAYTLYVVCFLMILFFANRSIRNRIVEKERMKSREKELAQAKEIEKAYNELKLTQAQLIQSEKMASLGELTAGIAHEIQNPLNFVNNFSEVNKELLIEMKDEMNKGNIEDAKAIADDVIENEEKINHHGKRAGDIVKGMLQHSRKSTGQKEPTDINALADEYLRLSYHGLRAKDKEFNATMKTDFDNSIGKINIIPQDIGRVLLNLYNNAFYACIERSRSTVNERLRQAQPDIHYEPTVSVRTSLNPPLEGREASVLITVIDNGNGIPKNIVDKIFQPFFTTKPTGQGTGLGLSLSYDIIKAHGGEIKVESKEGEGSTFIIQLPVV